jgi:hypothetical protein
MREMSHACGAGFKRKYGAIEHRRPQAYDFGAPGRPRIEMKKRHILALLAFPAMLLIASFSIAQSTGDGNQVQGQGAAANPSAPAPQGEESDSTLELAPQPGAMRPKVDEIPGGRSFRPGDDTASINRNFNPNTENGDSSRPARHGRPYLGIEVQYTTQCFLGKEEHGLQIVKVDPNSPAWAAGLHGPTPATAAGAAGMTLGAIIPPVDAILGHFLDKSGALGMGGDLIVAVDDQRVRDQSDLEAKMAQLKPGDTMYLTVIRPIEGGQHKTLKIAVKVGEWGQPLANAGSASSESSAR